MTGAILEAGWIADRIQEQGIAGGNVRLLCEQLSELHQGADTFVFIAMNAGEDTDPNRRVAAAVADEDVSRNFILFAAVLETADRFGDQAWCGDCQSIERRKPVGQGAPER